MPRLVLRCSSSSFRQVRAIKRLTGADLDDFVQCYREREETERFRRFSYEELIERDKLNLDIFWLKDDSLDDIDSLLNQGCSHGRSLRTSRSP